MSAPQPDSAAPAVRRELMDPVTGELLELATPAELAHFRDRLGQLKRLIDSTLTDVDAELVAELDRDNARSRRVGDWEISAPAALETVWDKAALGVALEALVQAGKLTRVAAAAALEPKPIEYKARARELSKLLGHADPEVVEAIEACRRAVPRDRRYVTVKRAAPAARTRLGATHDPQEDLS